MNKLLIICGPTATGKTALGIKLAKKFNGEIISADSRQVYRGMDIITGKDSSDEIPVWMLDVVNPDEKFNVADYYELAWNKIEDIRQRGKLPIIVGGTGFYIKALLEGIGTMGIGPNLELREELSQYSADKLLKILTKINPERSQKMNESDRRNPRRLIRAIEVSKNIKYQMVDGRSERTRENIDKLMIGLTAPYKDLYERIDKRVEERIKNGAEKEVKKLLDSGYGWNNSALGSTIGYQQWKEYFEEKIPIEKVIEKWQFAEHNYCRRQMTWFRKMPEIKWFDVTEREMGEKVEKLVENWYI